MTGLASERTGLDALKVRDIMVHPVRTVDPRTSVCELVQLLAREQISGVPVLDGSRKLLGVVSASDVIRLMASEHEVPSGDPLWDPVAWDEDTAEDDLLHELMTEREGGGEGGSPPQGGAGSVLDATTVGDIMTPATFTISPDATVRELAAFLTGGRIHRCLVVERGRLVGIVTSSDVVRALGCGTFTPT